jgi:hypothetical protein
MPLTQVQGGMIGPTGFANLSGITFPATQVPSADANTLDDYEEGTWTPVDGSGAGLSFTQSGTARYTKVGRIVFVSLYINFPSTANTSNVNIAGLPFTAVGSESYSYLSGRAGVLALSMGQVNTGSNGFTLYKASSSGVVNSELSSAYLILSGCYYAIS